MGNYQAKKLAAQQHNDAIDYRKWLINNTVGQTRQLPVATRKIGIIGCDGPTGVILSAALAYVSGFQLMRL